VTTSEASNTELIQKIQSLQSELGTLKLAKKEQNSKFEKLFTLAEPNTSSGLWEWDLASGQVYYSQKSKRLLGYEEDELDSTVATWQALIHPDDRYKAIHKASQYIFRKTDTFECEMRLRHKNGHYIFIKSRAYQLIVDENNKPKQLIGTHVDISERKKAELFNHRYTVILEMVAKGNVAAEIYNEIALMYEERNPGMRCSLLELDGDTLLHGGAPSLPEEYCEAVNGLKNGPNIGSCGTSTYTAQRVLVKNIETDEKWKDLKSFALPHGMRSCWSEPIKSVKGEVLGAFGMYYDHPALPTPEELNDLESAGRLAGIVMERDHNQKRIKMLAYTDQLTGLSSRAHLHLTLEDVIKSSSDSNSQFCLLYIDLDNFKNINDTLGHNVGDLHLQKIAKRLKDVSTEVDFIARLGGDEFCMVIPNMIDRVHAMNVALRCLDQIAKPTFFLDRKIIPSCSIGIACYPKDGHDFQSLLKAADTALYAAKDCGKNRYAFYKKELSEKAEYRFKVEQDLIEAIDQQQLTLAYQPIIDLKSGHIIGVEALSRWHHPQLGHISPAEFIPIAEQTGKIKKLTKWALHTACTQAVVWRESGLPEISMSVNISPNYFLERDLVTIVKQVINDTGISPEKIKLEVTEDAIQTSQKNLSIFNDLKELGVLIGLDDFGVGYSSFASLKHLDVDFLKIDKHFINGMMSERKTQLLVGSMIEMGHNLGYEITAEGIEEYEQLKIIKGLNCDTYQGFYFSEATSSENIMTMLKKDQQSLAND